MHAENNVIVRVEDLSVGYESTVILQDLNFEVFEGEVLAILGGSGSGKSTLLKHLIGLQTPFSGRIIIDGEELRNEDEKSYAHILHKIGVMYQGGALLGSMTLAENIALPIQEYYPLPEEALACMVKIKLGLVYLDGFQERLPEDLSGGMVKRASLARAMALDPKILFLDEPSAGLDPITSVELDGLIQSLNQSLGTTIILVTHELSSIYRIADRVVLLDTESKSIIAEGDPRYLRDHSQDPRVSYFFKPQSRKYPSRIEDDAEQGD